MRKLVFVVLVIIITGSMLFMAQGLEKASNTTVTANWLNLSRSSQPKPAEQPASKQPVPSETAAPAPPPTQAADQTPAQPPQPTPQPAETQPAAQSEAQPTQPPVQPAQQKTLTVSVPDAGKIITANTLQFTIGSARLSSGDEGLQPQKGNVFLIINARVDNNGNDSESISPVMVFQLVDITKGNRYSPQVISALDQQLDGNIGPGRTRNGQLRFEAPEAPAQYQLQIDASLVGAGTFPVTILVQ